MTPELTDEEKQKLEELRHLAYRRLLARHPHDTEFMDSFIALRNSSHEAERAYKAWLDSQPPEIVLFCRQVASAYQHCITGDLNQARNQLTMDLLIRPLADVDDFTRRMPEIMEMIASSMRDDHALTRTLLVLSQLLPLQSQDNST